MGKNVGESVIRPVLRSMGDMPVQVRQLGEMLRKRGDVHKKNKSDIEGNDKFDGTRGPVREFDMGTYKDLKKGETVRDALQHDHIPSKAAVIRAQENAIPGDLLPSQRRAIEQNSVAIEISDALHALSRTFKGRNTQPQIDLDASDLRAAMERDLSVLRTNLISEGRLTSAEIDKILRTIRDLNRARGIG